MHVKDRYLSPILLIAGVLAGMALAATPSHAQQDPPPGSARLAHLQGNVSIQPNGVDGWGQADSNMPIGAGDRVFTDQGAKAEVQAGPVRAYLSSGSDMTLVNVNPQGSVELGLAQGTAEIYSDGFLPGSGFSIQTPNGAVTIAGRAHFRLDVYKDQESVIVSDSPDFSELALNGAGGYFLILHPGESIQLSGENPVYAQPVGPAPLDDFARWSNALEAFRLNSISARYVNAEMIGYDELDQNGDWQAASDYGPIWFPRVQAGWAPYHYGHWVSRPFYGWTWVADEPWGAAPFHYGRWVVVGGRWGWIPGPREGHPVWSPAQVVFAGGIQFGGGSVAVWFPLGPGEAYRPWYPCTPQYINQVNITNIHESTVVHVQVNYVNIVNVTNVTYVNRTTGVTAMNQADFAAGRPTRTVAVKIAPSQLEHIQPARPEAKPPAQPVIQHPIAKPAAAPAARPVLINKQGKAAPAAPNAKPVEVPVKTTPPVIKPIPGRAPIGKPSVGGKPVQAAAPAPVAPKAAPAPVKPEPAKPEPAKTAPAKTVPAKPAAPAPAEKTAPAKAATPPPAAKPQPATSEAKPAKPGEAKPATPSKDDKKKKDAKKTPPSKPE